MAYFLKIVDAGMTREVERWKKATPKKRREAKRAAKANPTPPEMENINRTNAFNKLRRAVNANFTEGDYWIALTYAADGPRPELGQAFEDYRKFAREMRKLYAKFGVTLKYISVTEQRKHKRPHHHIILPQGVPIGAIQSIWPHGRIHVKPLDDLGQYSALAVYIFEHTDIPERRGKRWNSSQNLEHPEPVEKTSKAKHWREQPTAPKGWMIDKTTPIERGVNPITGAEYLKYTLIKLVDKSRQKRPRVCAGATTMRN